MSKIFELFHLSLVPRSSLFSGKQSREEWLKEAFQETFEFTHRRKTYFWVPQKISGITEIFGTVARKRRKIHHQPPEEGALEVEGEEWQGAWVIIDPSHHDDGQKLSFERDDTIGTPSSVLASLLATVNARMSAPYAIEPKQIFDEAHFWEWSSAHNNLVRRITFDFVVPNMWGTSSDLDEDLKEVGVETGARKARVSFESDDGVKTDTDKVREGIEYSARGGGSVTAHALNGDRYYSTKKPRTARLDAQILNEKDKAVTLIKWVSKILGRE